MQTVKHLIALFFVLVTMSMTFLPASADSREGITPNPCSGCHDPDPKPSSE